MPVPFPPALDLSLDLLRCPACHTRRLHPERTALRCP
ncbi:methyltransferase type 11, partial [Streptomyces sp. NPDC057674]